MVDYTKLKLELIVHETKQVLVNGGESDSCQK